MIRITKLGIWANERATLAIIVMQPIGKILLLEICEAHTSRERQTPGGKGYKRIKFSTIISWRRWWNETPNRLSAPFIWYLLWGSFLTTQPMVTPLLKDIREVRLYQLPSNYLENQRTDHILDTTTNIFRDVTAARHLPLWNRCWRTCWCAFLQ